MHSTCLHCNRALGANQALETLPIGRRIAFDAATGRLWVVCRHCAKWNLVPFESRLESIDGAERLYRDTVTRYSTDNIGLARVREGLELVRIGPALRPEFASWRYGESYRRRRRNSYLIGGTAVAGVAGAAFALGVAGVVTGGMAYMVAQAVKGGWNAALNRRSRFKVVNPADGSPVTIDRKLSNDAVVSWEREAPSLEVMVPTPGQAKHDFLLLTWGEHEVQTVGRRVTGALNMLHGSRRDLDVATRLLADERGDLARWMRLRAVAQRQEGKQEPTETERKLEKKHGAPSRFWREYRHPFLLPGRLPGVERLAVEMWMNEDIERTWLEGELKLLEREWREADRLAKIADDLILEPEDGS